MSSEAIALVLADIDGGNHFPPRGLEPKVSEYARAFWINPTIVDATPVYEACARRLGEQVEFSFHDDHPSIAPPWDEFAVCFENKHGNVHVMHATVMPIDAFSLSDTSRAPGSPPWIPSGEGVDHEIDWPRVRWRLDVYLWTGGRSRGAPADTGGPVVLWQIAIHDDGSLADLHYVIFAPDFDADDFVLHQLVLLGSLNFLNCSNVDIAVPQRQRAARRRLERITDKVIHEINVFPIGRSTRSGARPGSPDGAVPFHPVRGHFASYGPKYDKGLLFGKYEGRFFIPQHVRGSKDAGEHEATYRLRADKTA